MFVDFLTLMLINLTAGFFLLAHFAYRGLGKSEAEDEYRGWAPGFALIGLIAVLTGLVMIFTWPLPGSNNIAFGENSTLFGGLFLATSLAFGRRLKLQSLAVFALLAGVVAIVVGARILDLGMTQHPALSAAGFILSGAGGVFASGALAFERVRANRIFRLGFALIMLATGVIWAVVAFDGYWSHLSSFSTWKPK